MCGITGIWFANPINESQLREKGLAMATAVTHRGPDAANVWIDSRCELVLAHRRLSILDLTEAGSQPMQSSCGRFFLTYNGECYNFPELRAKLQGEGCQFRSHSDTEVIVEGCSKWGISHTVERLNGMFAFALWDSAERSLVLVRDRVGIKPLYYGWQPGIFWFGSELKSMHVVAELQPELNQTAVAFFLKFGYIPSPHCIFSNFNKLSPGCMLRLTAPDAPRKEVAFWSRYSRLSNGELEAYRGTHYDAVEELDFLLRRSVKQQMVSDVPLGAFLSGGVDSSTVVAMMQAQSSQRVKTFTIGFQEEGFDESDAARSVSSYLGTEHTEYILTPGEAWEVIPTVIQSFDEPFADASQIPTYVVSRLARGEVSVCLSGDGGDELFAGYSHYSLCAKRLRQIENWPSALHSAAKAGINLLSEKEWDALLRCVRRKSGSLSGHKLRKYAAIIGEKGRKERYELMISRWFFPSDVMSDRSFSDSLVRTAMNDTSEDAMDMMMRWDMEAYLPEDILTKLDRTSMSVSLESRVPILDNDIIDFSLHLPLSAKRHDNTGKWVLRQVLERYLPVSAVHRPKKGFSIPIGQWLRGPLQEWAADLLAGQRLNACGFFHAPTLKRKWEEHLKGTHDWENLLWPVITFEAWRGSVY